MPRFRFRLQSVLDVRQRVCDLRRRELAQCQRELELALTQHAQVSTDRDAQRATLTLEHRTLDGDTLRAIYAHLNFLDRAIDQALERITVCRTAVEAAHARLLTAETDRKVLDTLRSRRLEVHVAQAAQIEQREVDDQNARRYGRAQQLLGDQHE